MSKLETAVPKKRKKVKTTAWATRRGKAPRRRNSSRKKVWRRKPSDFARIYGSKKRVAWVRALGCIARSSGCHGPVDNAHVPSRSGMSRKGDAWQIVPLCRAHHRELHDDGYVEAVDIDARSVTILDRDYLQICADATEQAWQEHQRRAS